MGCNIAAQAWCLTNRPPNAVMVVAGRIEVVAITVETLPALAIFITERKKGTKKLEGTLATV